jgi:hypothetical protein
MSALRRYEMLLPQ